MELFALQVVFVVSLSAVTVTSALLPILWLWIKSKKSASSSDTAVDPSLNPSFLTAAAASAEANPKTQKVLSAANAFSCGVFLAMVVFSLLPGITVETLRLERCFADTHFSHESDIQSKKYGHFYFLNF